MAKALIAKESPATRDFLVISGEFGYSALHGKEEFGSEYGVFDRGVNRAKSGGVLVFCVCRAVYRDGGYGYLFSCVVDFDDDCGLWRYRGHECPCSGDRAFCGRAEEMDSCRNGGEGDCGSDYGGGAIFWSPDR